jgi:hypothetical protein
MRSPCVCVNFDSKAVYQSLHQLTIIPPILGSATLVTCNKSWELPTNCRKTMLELVRISRLNVCHYKGDFEPQTRGNHAMAEIAEPKYDTEAANENVHLVTETSSPALVPDLPTKGSESAPCSNSTTPRTADTVSPTPEPDRVSKRRNATCDNVSCSLVDEFGWRDQAD